MLHLPRINTELFLDTVHTHVKKVEPFQLFCRSTRAVGDPYCFVSVLGYSKDETAETGDAFLVQVR